MVVRISDKTQNYSKVTKLLVKPNTLKELSKEDLEKVLDFSRELQDINYSKGKNDSRDGKGQK